MMIYKSFCLPNSYDNSLKLLYKVFKSWRVALTGKWQGYFTDERSAWKVLKRRDLSDLKRNFLVKRWAINDTQKSSSSEHHLFP